MRTKHNRLAMARGFEHVMPARRNERSSYVDHCCVLKHSGQLADRVKQQNFRFPEFRSNLRTPEHLLVSCFDHFSNSVESVGMTRSDQKFQGGMTLSDFIERVQHHFFLTRHSAGCNPKRVPILQESGKRILDASV